MLSIDKNYYPGWVRKAISFTNDDGNIKYDTKFIEILKPYGILGTFNLCSNTLDIKRGEEYRALYRGYGIQNHCDYHPFAFDPEVEYKFTDAEFNPDTADKSLVYKTDTPGLYRYCAHRWWNFAKGEDYCGFIKSCHDKLKEIFGDFKLDGFVWPFCEQKDPKIKEFLKNIGYRAARKTGALKDTTGFSLPKDRFAWSYNATNVDLLEVAELYENYPDDSELKFFCFGLHSVDYENGSSWGALEEFARKYGNRPENYYYASVDDIFDYEDAVSALEIGEDYVKNPTDITLYIKVDGERIILRPKSTYKKS